MVTEARRLTILSSEEISSLYDLPKFNDDDRRLYFDLSTVERDADPGYWSKALEEADEGSLA